MQRVSPLQEKLSDQTEHFFDSWRLFIGCLLVCIVGLVLRAYYTPSPWILDEIFTLLFADVPPRISFYLSYVYDRHGPGYFTLLSVVHAATGSHFFTYYHSYVLLGVLVILLLWPRVNAFDSYERMVAASLFLVMPYVLLMASEMRMYLFEASLAWGIWLCLVGHYEGKRSGLLLGLALMLALIAAYAHFVGFLIGFSGLSFFATVILCARPEMPDRRLGEAYRRDAILFSIGFLVLAFPAIANFLFRAVRAPSAEGYPFGLGGLKAVGMLALANDGVTAGLVSMCALLAVIVVVGRADGRARSAVRLATSIGFILLPGGVVALLGFLGSGKAPRAGFYSLPFVALTIAALLRRVRGPSRPVLAVGMFVVLVMLSLYQTATARPKQDYSALTRYLATTPRDQPIGFLHVIDLWMVAREMGSGGIAPKQFFKPLAELGPVARSQSLRSLLDIVGLTEMFSWKQISAVEVDGRVLRLVNAGELSSWVYDTPIVWSWGGPVRTASGCEVSRAGFVVFLRRDLCGR